MQCGLVFCLVFVKLHGLCCRHLSSKQWELLVYFVRRWNFFDVDKWDIIVGVRQLLRRNLFSRCGYCLLELRRGHLPRHDGRSVVLAVPCW